MLFTSAVTVPARVCKPDQPSPWIGPAIQYTNNWATISGSSANRALGQGTPTLTSADDSIQSSWLVACNDDAAGDAATKLACVADTQHAFGRFGQANVDPLYYPSKYTSGVAGITGQIAYSYSSTTSATPGVMISIFPQAIGNTDVLDATGEKIVLEV